VEGERDLSARASSLGPFLNPNTQWPSFHRKDFFRTVRHQLRVNLTGQTRTTEKSSKFLKDVMSNLEPYLKKEQEEYLENLKRLIQEVFYSKVQDFIPDKNSPLKRVYFFKQHWNIELRDRSVFQHQIDGGWQNSSHSFDEVYFVWEMLDARYLKYSGIWKKIQKSTFDRSLGENHSTNLNSIIFSYLS
jgi:hypothetical protein